MTEKSALPADQPRLWEGDDHAYGPQRPQGTSRGDGSGESRIERPPPVRMRYGDEAVDLQAYTFCYGNACVDGVPPAHPPSVGSPTMVEIEFPLDGWSFGAIFEPAGERCGRLQTVEPLRTRGGTHLLRPAGYAGTYDVTLFGRGNGDLFTVFRWSTPVDGPLPVPEARLALVAGHDGRVDSYGVELAISNLASSPLKAAAQIKVTAANGESLTFEATPAVENCRREGAIYWDGPDEQGTAAARLGRPPFTYKVVLTLDGTRHAATAHWPEDVIQGNEPSVKLIFTPALPALD